MAKTLLLADDSVTIQKVVNISFASEDVTLVTVDNGDDAIRRALETRPDLILADVVMPGKNGYEVCEAVKAHPDLAHIPVLLLTGTFEAFDEERAARVGAAGHVAKPFEAQTLVDRVNRLLAEAPPAASAAAPPAAPAAAPAAPPEAVTAPSSSGDANEDSFDFFDDDLNELQEPEPAEPASDAIRFDDSDSAFAFGDDDLTPAQADDDQTPADFFVTPERDSGTTDRTVAILPDEPGDLDSPFDASAETPPTALSGLESELSDLALGGGDDDDVETLDEADDPFASIDAGSTDDEPFDFSFDRAPAPPDPALEGTVLNAEAADLVQATVLDPNGASGYDVSSSDRGAPFAAEPVVDAGASLREPAPRSAPPAPPRSRPAPPDPSEFATSPPPEVAARGPRPGAFEAPPAPPRPSAPPPVFAPPEPPEAEFAAAEPFDADFDASEPLDAGFALAETDDPSVSADAVLAQIAPSLREQLHDTLEKAAWESFGNLTEKIVSETVDRIEKVAWEVIPQLAEALIKQEIRRLKGDLDD